MYVELSFESNPKEPIAGDEPPIPGAVISVRSHVETTAYRNCWCIEVDDVAGLTALLDGTPIEVLDPIHSGTDALVRVLDGPVPDPEAAPAGV